MEDGGFVCQWTKYSMQQGRERDIQTENKKETTQKKRRLESIKCKIIIALLLLSKRGRAANSTKRCGGYGTGWVSMAAGTMTMLLF